MTEEQYEKACEVQRQLWDANRDLERFENVERIELSSTNTRSTITYNITKGVESEDSLSDVHKKIFASLQEIVKAAREEAEQKIKALEEEFAKI